MAKSTILPRLNTVFFRKILEKYRTGKRGRFRFPVMILRKNANHYLPQTINLNIFLQFHFHNQSGSYLSSMSVKNIKEFIKDALRIKELAHIQGETKKQLIRHENPIGFIDPRTHGKISDRKIHSDKPSFSGTQGSGVFHSILGHKSPAILFERDFSRNYILSQTYSGSVYSISHGGIVDRLLNHVNYIYVNNPGIHEAGNDNKEDIGNHSQKGNIMKINSIFEYNARHVLLLNNDLIRNNFIKFDSYQRSNNILPGMAKMFFGHNNLHIINPQMTEMRSYLEQVNMQNIMLTGLMPTATTSKMVKLQIRKNMKSYYNDSQNVFTLLKTFIKNPGYTIPDSLISSSGKKGTSFMMKNEKYIFNKTREIEKEVDDIKKIVIETKKTMAEKSTSIPLKNATKPNFDINRIADQVYQNIERRIRIERERKGI